METGTEREVRPRTAERRRAPPLPRPFGRRSDDQIELTDRQREVLQLVAEGLENKEIAGLLGISEQGVKQQVSVLLRKFQVPSRASLTRTAITMKLLGTSEHPADIPVEYLFDRAPLLIAMTRGPEHTLVLANRALREMFGEREYIGRTLREAFPEAPPPVFAALATIHETGHAYRTNEQWVTVSRPDGSVREVCLSFIAEPRRSPEGVVDGVVFYGWDITENVRMRERLQQVTVEQRTLVEQLPVGVIYTDDHARPVVVNPVARRMLGGAVDAERPLYETLVGWNIRYASSGVPLAPSDAPSARAISGWPFDDELLVEARDGTMRIHVSSRPLHDEKGAVTGAVLVLSDRTPAGIPAERGMNAVPGASGPSGDA